MIKIAILGLGTVGTGVVKVVEANTAPIQHKLGQPLSVKTALVRKLRADPYQHLMTENFREIEHDGEIRVVVETIGGVEAAYEYTRRCLMAGKHVVTANKQLVAEHGCELLDLDYREDSRAEIDMNLVATDTGEIVEIQGTGEQTPFDRKRLNNLLDLGDLGIKQLIDLQNEVTAFRDDD